MEKMEEDYIVAERLDDVLDQIVVLKVKNVSGKE